MAQQAYQVIVRMNNVKHAFPGELSLAFPDASGGIKSEVIQDNHGGNTSASLLAATEDETVVFHILVDAGMGTVRRLTQTARYASPKRIDLVLITHGDIDHHSELVYACEMPVRLKKRGMGGLTDQPQPIPIYAPEGAAKRLGEIYSYTMACPDAASGSEERKRLESKAKNGWLHPVRPLYPTAGLSREPKVSEGPDRDHQFTITPVGGVGHRNGVIYIVEFGLAEMHKVVFAWDMERLPWSGLAPQIAEGVRGLLSEADLMFVEMNTCLPRKTGHICYDEVDEFVKKTVPKECYIVHYSGFEDQFPGEKDQDAKTDTIKCVDQLDKWLEEQGKSTGLPTTIKCACPDTLYPADGPFAWE